MDMIKYRKLKRVRSDSADDIEYGIEYELEDRFRKVVNNFVKMLRRSNLISFPISLHISSSGLVDDIVELKMRDGKDKLYSTFREEEVLGKYVKMQTNIEKGELLSISRDLCVLDKNHPFTCEDIIIYILEFIG